MTLPDLSNSYRFVSQKWSFGESVPALTVEVCATTLLHSLWSQVIMGTLPSYRKKSRTSRICATSYDLLPDGVKLPGGLLGRQTEFTSQQPKSQLLCPKGCCLTAVKTSAVISSIWQDFGQIMCPWLGRPELRGCAGCFFAFFFLWNTSIQAPNSPLWLFGGYWFFFLSSSLLYPALKVWFCKEGPAENLAKHLVLKARKLPQYNSYLLITYII